MAQITPESCCILNGGGGAWAFDGLAEQLGRAIWIDVSATPREINYLLMGDDIDPASLDNLFIPYQAMHLK